MCPRATGDKRKPGLDRVKQMPKIPARSIFLSFLQLLHIFIGNTPWLACSNSNLIYRPIVSYMETSKFRWFHTRERSRKICMSVRTLPFLCSSLKPVYSPIEAPVKTGERWRRPVEMDKILNVYWQSATYLRQFSFQWCTHPPSLQLICHIADWMCKEGRKTLKKDKRTAFNDHQGCNFALSMHRWPFGTMVITLTSTPWLIYHPLVQCVLSAASKRTWLDTTHFACTLHTEIYDCIADVPCLQARPLILMLFFITIRDITSLSGGYF